MTDTARQARTLGDTGVQLSPFTLGTMMFGSWGNADLKECRQIIDVMLDSGINCIDSADVYGAGAAEEVVGSAIKGRRDNVVLLTKFHGRMGTNLNEAGGSRVWFRRALQGSLSRLGTDYIDVYQVHRPDPMVSDDRLLDLFAPYLGKDFLYYGLCNYPARRIVRLEQLSRLRGTERPAVVQVPYSIFARGVEQEILPTAAEGNLGVVSYAPLNGGWLTEKYVRGETPPNESRADRQRIPERFDFDRRDNQLKFDYQSALSVLAKDAGLTLISMALAWVASNPVITSVILGPRTIDQASELAKIISNLPALSVDVLDRIDSLLPIGVTLNPFDNSYQDPALTANARRAPSTKDTSR